MDDQHLSIIERWKKEKASRNSTKPANDQVANKYSNDSLYKKVGEECSHPPELVHITKGPNIGRVKVCVGCGRIIEENVRPSAEDKEEEEDTRNFIRQKGVK